MDRINVTQRTAGHGLTDPADQVMANNTGKCSLGAVVEVDADTNLSTRREISQTSTLALASNDASVLDHPHGACLCKINQVMDHFLENERGTLKVLEYARFKEKCRLSDAPLHGQQDQAGSSSHKAQGAASTGSEQTEKTLNASD